jgi:hypothetical protein
MSADNNNQAGGGFDKLLGELETMTKALPSADASDDKKIQAAAGEGGDDVNAKKEGEGEDGEGGEMAKSFKVTLADGTELEAQDGTELVKSLMDKVGAQEDLMVKALDQTLTIIKAQGEQLKAQDGLIKSLTTKVEALGKQGTGRKSILDVHAQASTLAKSLGAQEQGPTPQDIMAKSQAAFAAGKISGQEANTIDVSLRMGAAIEPALLAKLG